MYNLADYAEKLGSAIQLHGRLVSEGKTVLKALQEKLSELNGNLAPIHERATALTWAEDNITRTKIEANELLQHIEASRKVENTLRMGPGRTEAQLEPFLAAVGRLEEALTHLESYMEQGNAEAIQQAYDDALSLHDRAMRDSEADFAAVLAQHGAARLPSAAWLAEKASPEQLRASLSNPELDLLPPAAISRVSRLAEVMLRARHVTCLDTYAQARSRALDMLLALVGLDPSSLPAGLALQSADQLQRLVGGWALQLRVLLVGAAAELALAQEVWQSPYDEVTFSETISRSLRLVLQVGKAVCEGRGSGRGAHDRVFVLLQMHQSLMDLLPYLHDLLSSRERCTGLLNEAHVLGVMIGRSARQLFTEFEEGVGSRGGQGGGGSGSEAVSKLTMLDGTVHPICATTLSFLKRLFTYPNALTLLFSPGASSVSSAGGGSAADAAEVMAAAAAAAASSSIMKILMRLLEVLEAKAKAYKTPALGDLFLMNNVHYMVWTVEQASAADKQRSFTQPKPAARATRGQASSREEEDEEDEAGDGDGEGRGAKHRGGAGRRRAAGSAAAAADSTSDDEAGGGGVVPPAAAAARGGGGGSSSSGAAAGGLAVLGHAWVERHKDIVEHYGAAYQEKTWGPMISLLEAVLVTEEDPEPADPGRFKTWVKSKFSKINSHLDGILKQQSAWTIPDGKLKTAVRNVIKQDVLPLYGEFWERYTAVEFTTHPEKYLRYPPDQLEHVIDHTLFEGRAAAPRGGGGGGAPGGISGGSLATMSVGSRWSNTGPGSVRSSAPGRVGASGSAAGLGGSVAAAKGTRAGAGGGAGAGRRRGEAG